MPDKAAALLQTLQTEIQRHDFSTLADGIAHQRALADVWLSNLSEVW
jgi:hypothetical protein